MRTDIRSPDPGVEPTRTTASLPPPLVRPTRHPLTWARQHVAMLAAKSQSKPYMFLKLQDSVIGPGEDIVKPPES